MAWYEKSGGGHRARYRLPGKRAPLSGPIFPTPEAAKAWAVSNGHDHPEINTIAELVDRWDAVMEAEKRNMPSYRLELKEKVLALASARGWVRIRDVSMIELDKWKIEAKGVGISKRLALLLSVLRWGRRQYGLAVDAAVLRHGTPQARRKVMADALLTNAQVSRLMEAAIAISPSVGALIHYLSTYGPRPITACTRKISDVDFKGGTILVDGKRSGQWRHAIDRTTLVYFSAAAKGRPVDDPLFLAPYTGKGWKVDAGHSATALCEWYRRNLGRPICGKALDGIYNLKRYAITGMLRRGVDAATVAKFTGHLSLPQVLLYARGNLKTTKEALKLVCVPLAHKAHRKGKRKS